jgi:hypothetical protein
MRLGLGEEAFEAAEDLQEGRNGGVMERHGDALFVGRGVEGSAAANGAAARGMQLSQGQLVITFSTHTSLSSPGSDRAIQYSRDASA